MSAFKDGAMTFFGDSKKTPSNKIFIASADNPKNKSKSMGFSFKIG